MLHQYKHTYVSEDDHRSLYILYLEEYEKLSFGADDHAWMLDLYLFPLANNKTIW